MMQEQDGNEFQPESMTPEFVSEPEVVEPPPQDPILEELPAPKKRLRRVLLWAVSLIIIGKPDHHPGGWRDLDVDITGSTTGSTNYRDGGGNHLGARPN
jgi:hypothetical protein